MNLTATYDKIGWSTFSIPDLKVPTDTHKLFQDSGIPAQFAQWTCVVKSNAFWTHTALSFILFEWSIGVHMITNFNSRELLKQARIYLQITDNFDKFQPLDEDALQIKMKAKADEVFANIEPVTSENAGTRICTRMERETLSRLPKTRAILFTIKTYIKPLERFKKDPEKVRNSEKDVWCHYFPFRSMTDLWKLKSL